MMSEHSQINPEMGNTGFQANDEKDANANVRSKKCQVVQTALYDQVKKFYETI